MPYANVVGFVIEPEMAAKHVQIPDLNEPWGIEELDEAASELDAHFHEQLIEAHAFCLKTAFQADVELLPNGKHRVTKDDVSQEFSVFDIAPVDDEVEQFIFLHLSDRYTPVFLDYKQAHGGMYPYVELDKEFWYLANMAKQKIGEFFPEIFEADLVVFTKWF